MRRPACFALSLLAFAAGLAAGASFSIGRRAADFSAGVERRLAEKNSAPAAAAGESRRGFASDEEALTAMMSAVAEEEPFLRAHRIHDLLGSLDAAECGVLFARALHIEDGERRRLVLEPLLARWATLDSAAATAAVRPYLDRCRALGHADWRRPETAVYFAWLHAQPEAALAEALASPKAGWARGAASAAMQTLADRDPARQLDLLARLPASRLREGLCRDAIQALADRDSAAAEKYLDLLSNPRERAGLQADILGKLAERDPAAGLARLAALAPGLNAGAADWQLVSTVLRAAAKKDASAAFAALDGLPGEFRSEAQAAVLTGWAGEHPADALAWTVTNGVALNEVKEAVDAALSRDRAGTLEWLRGQPASPQRDVLLIQGIGIGSLPEQLALYAEVAPEAQAHMVQNIVGGLLAEDPKRAEAWVKDQPPGEVRAMAVQALMNRQVWQYPDHLDTLADAWPPGPDRDVALQSVSFPMAMTDPLRAVTFLERIGDPAKRDESMYFMGLVWLGRDATAAKAWITGTPDLSAESKRVLLRRYTGR